MTADNRDHLPDESITLAAAQRIDATCDAFEARWRAGERPRIEEFMRSEAHSRDSLLRELLRIEVEYRTQAGELVRRDDYLSRFPEFASIVVAVVPAEPWKTSVSHRTHWFDSTNSSLSGHAKKDTTLTSVADGCSGTRVPVHAVAPAIGSDFGPYCIMAELGHGGMGIVYRALHSQLGRVVALKIINPSRLAFDRATPREQAVARFRYEAEAAAQFEHANIVQIFDVGTIEGRHYYAMRFVAGASLAQLVEKGPLAPRRAARYLATAARAAEEIHTAGFLHRDLKPGNILVEEDTDTPFVADFGLAKFVEASQGDTLTGDVFGTPPYMSPEQLVDSSRATTSSDIYSLGATLYHLVTGQPPFQAETAIETARQALECAVVPPRRLNPAINRELEAICLKALEKSPNDRYRTAGALANDLEAWLEGRPIKARPATASRRLVKLVRRRPRAVATVLAVIATFSLVFAVATFSAIRARHAERTALQDKRLRQSQELVEKGNRFIESGDPFSAQLMFAAALGLDSDDAARSSVHRSRVTATEAAVPRLEGIQFCDAAVIATAVDPTGKYFLAADSDGQIRVWTTAVRESLCKKPLGGAITTAGFSPDGKQVFAGLDDGRLLLLATATGELLDEMACGAAIRCAVFDPSGTKLAVGLVDGRTMIREMSGGKPTDTLEHGDSVKSAAFSPDGQLLATASLDGFVRVWNVGTEELVVAPLDCDGAVNTVAISQEGTSLAAGGLDGKVRVWELGDDAPALVSTFDHGGTISRVEFSPDGSRLLSSGEHRLANLWNVEDGHLVASLGHEAPVTALAFDAESRRIATGSQDQTARIWNASTGASLTPPLKHADSVTSVCFLPQSHRLVTASADQGVRVWDHSDRRPRRQLEQRQPLTAIAVADDRTAFATASKDRSIQVTSSDLTKSDDVRWKLPNPASCIAIGRSQRWLATGGFDNRARLFQLESTPVEMAPLPHDGPVLCVALSPDERWLATACHDGHVRLWEVSTGRPAGDFEYRAAVTHVAFSSDGLRVLSVCHGTAYISPRDPSSDLQLLEFPHGDMIHSACLSADGSLLLSACADGAARVWNVETEAVVAELHHADSVLGACFAVADTQVLTYSTDSTARLWDIGTAVETSEPLKHEQPVDRAACSPDGRFVITASRDCTVRVWDAATSESVGPTPNVDSSVLDFLFVGPRALVVCTSGAVTSLELNGDQRPVDQIEAWAQVVSCRRHDPELGTLPLSTDQLRRAAIRSGLATQVND